MIATVAQCVVLVDDPAAQLVASRGQPRLTWTLREFIRYGVTDFVLVAARTGVADAIARMEFALPRPVRVIMAEQPTGSGTGGALFHVRGQLQDRFLVSLGGAPFDWNLASLLAEAARDEAKVAGRIAWSDTLQSWSIGLFRRHWMDHLNPVCALEADVLPALDKDVLRRTPVGGAPPVVHWGRNALFLDRDGVLNIDHGYVGSRDRFEWVDGALDAIRYASNGGWHVFIVTNQSGVARGRYTEAAVVDLLNWIGDQARAAGGTIDDARFCPFHPDASVEAYRQAHPWRKPLPGMLLDLMRAWDVAPNRAVMIGDQATDMAAAAAADVAGHLFPGGNLFTFLRPILDGHPG